MSLSRGKCLILVIIILLSALNQVSAQRPRRSNVLPGRQKIDGFDEYIFTKGNEYSSFGNDLMALFYFLEGSKNLIKHMEKRKKNNQRTQQLFRYWLRKQYRLVNLFGEFTKSIGAGKYSNQIRFILKPFSGYYIASKPLTCEAESFVIVMDFVGARKLSIEYGTEAMTDYLDLMQAQPSVEGYDCEGQSLNWQRPLKVIEKSEAFFTNHPKSQYRTEIRKILKIAKRDYERLKKRAEERD